MRSWPSSKLSAELVHLFERSLGESELIQPFESKTLELHDFYFTGDDYRYRFELDAKRRFIQALREQFDSGVKYKSCVLKWDAVIEQKTNELGRFLVGKSSVLEFDEPAPRLERQDNHEIRAKILALTQSKAKQLGIGKSTLHYLRRSASNNHPVHTYYKTRRKLRSESRDDTCRVKSAVEN
jgi:hypothetical protein